MNYMKILLIYMAATMSMAVQSTSAPVETPVPEVTAVYQEQSGETPSSPAVLTPTPAPETPTPPPVPEITPNKKYRNLAKNDKGAAVKALQERLIELGYLPEGAADGAYGNQTYKAVRQFQRYNGLTVDGIAGKRTQTYLFENPDVNPYPTATPTPEITPTPGITPVPEETEAPEEIPEETVTEAPTEQPTAEPTAEPTEEPTAEPTAEPTEEPTAEPTAEPAEEPTAEPAAEPTEEPTAEPTQEPTAEPAPERTASAPVTRAPATEPPVAKPTMSVEDIDPESLQFVDAPGSVAYNESGAPLSWIALEDGVPVEHSPRLQKRDGKIRISLDDLAACLESWILTDDGNTVILEAEGRTLALLNEDAGIVATLDGTEIAVTPMQFDFGEGHFISAEFLAGALGGESRWAEDENTLILRIPEAEKR